MKCDSGEGIKGYIGYSRQVRIPDPKKTCFGSTIDAVDSGVLAFTSALKCVESGVNPREPQKLYERRFQSKSTDCGYISSYNNGNEPLSGTKKTGQRKMPNLTLTLPLVNSVTEEKKTRLKTPQLSQVSQIVRLSVRGDRRLTSAPISILDLESDCYQFSVPPGGGHRLVRVMTIREGDNQLPCYVIKLTSVSSKDLMNRYHDDLTLTMFQQAWTDYVACKCFGNRVEARFPGQVIVPETRVACIRYQDLVRIYGEALSENKCYQFISNYKNASEALCVFAIIQQYIEMRRFSESDKLSYKEILDFFKEEIRDSANAELSSESANLKLDVKNSKPVFFDLEFRQMEEMNMMHEFTAQQNDLKREELLAWPLFSEAFEKMPDLRYNKPGFFEQPALRNSFGRISLSTSSTACNVIPLSDAESDSGIESDAVDHGVSPWQWE